MGEGTGRPASRRRLSAGLVRTASTVRPVRDGRAGSKVRPLPRRAGAPFRLLAQPALRVRSGSLRRRGGSRAVPAGRSGDVGQRHGGRAHRDGARLARLAVRDISVAAAHQRAPHRGRRHRVPDDDHGRQRVARPDRARDRPPVPDGPARQQRVARGWLDEGFSDFQEGWFFETHTGQWQYPDLEAEMLFLDLDRWSEPVSMVSERYRDFLIYSEMVYSKAQLFYEQLRYVVGDDAMRVILRAYFARWKLKHVSEDAFREVAEQVSGQDLKWLFGQWLHGTPLIDYKLKRVERRRLPDGRWRTAVTIGRRGDGWMPGEIGDRDTLYARATGQPVEERVEFTTVRKPGRLMLDPRLRTHDYDMLNNREPRFGTGRRAVEHRLDDPTRETARRDRLGSAWMPGAWWDGFGGVTAGVRQGAKYLGRYDRGLLFGSVGTRAGATERIGFSGRWSNPIGHLTPRTETSLAAWAVEGRAGVALSVDHSLRRHLGFGADPHVGFDVLWMATTDLGYLDRRLWDDAGTVEAGPRVAPTVEGGQALLPAPPGAPGGGAEWEPRPRLISAHRDAV